MCKEIKMISAGFPFSLLYMTNPRGPARNTIIKLNKIKSGVRQDHGERCDAQKFYCEQVSFKFICSNCIQDDDTHVLRSNCSIQTTNVSTCPRGVLGPHLYSMMQTLNGRLGHPMSFGVAIRRHSETSFLLIGTYSFISFLWNLKQCCTRMGVSEGGYGKFHSCLGDGRMNNIPGTRLGEWIEVRWTQAWVWALPLAWVLWVSFSLLYNGKDYIHCQGSLRV